MLSPPSAELRARPPETGVGVRVHAAVVAGLLACLLVVVVLTAVALSRQHERLLALTAAERGSQLEDAAARVADDFDDVAGDLDFALEQVEQAPDVEAARRSLTALLGSVRRYRSAAVAGPDCEALLVVRDPRWSWSESDALDAAVADTVRRACSDPSVVVSRPPSDPELKWFRVFARARRDRGPTPTGLSVVALVVDTAPVLDRLRTLTADASAELLVLGPHGSPAPVTGPAVAGGLAAGSPSFTRLADHMRRGETGVVVVPAAEALALGYPDAELVAVFRPIPVADAAPGWSAAVIVSAERVQAHERALALALLASGAAGTTVLGLLVAYVVRVGRAEAAAQDRLRIAEALAHLRERAERILDHVPAGVVALGRDGAATSANVTFERWAGRSPVGATLAAMLASDPPETVARLELLVAEAARGGRARELTAERLTLFGREGTFTVRAVPIAPATAEVAALLVVDDLTELRALEDQLLRTEKLATVGVLAAGIAHEVGTPLGVIRGRAELVARKLGPDHAQARSLQAIVEQIDAISRTIRALMDFATPRRAVAGALDLAVPVARVGELLHYEADKRRVELRSVVPEGLPLVGADADRLQQVLVNLVMNAFDACAPGGVVRVEASAPADPAHDGFVSLVVSDNGAGIPPEHLHRVFDPFFTTKKRGQGTGLGLAVVNQIVRDSGGVVRVESQPGRGTTVEVLLPAIRGGVGG